MPPLQMCPAGVQTQRAPVNPYAQMAELPYPQQDGVGAPGSVKVTLGAPSQQVWAPQAGVRPTPPYPQQFADSVGPEVTV